MIFTGAQGIFLLSSDLPIENVEGHFGCVPHDSGQRLTVGKIEFYGIVSLLVTGTAKVE